MSPFASYPTNHPPLSVAQHIPSPPSPSPLPSTFVSVILVTNKDIINWDMHQLDKEPDETHD